MDKKLAFNCRTLEDAQDFIYQCIKRDIQVWRCANWDIYKEDTCYRIQQGYLHYSNKDCYLSHDYEILTYEKGDSVFGERFEHLKGEGQCQCDICKSINWTSWCYRVFDKTSEHNHKVICSNCKRRIEDHEKV